MAAHAGLAVDDSPQPQNVDEETDTHLDRKLFSFATPLERVAGDRQPVR